MKKKVLSVLLCGVLTASMLAGCGKEDTPDTETSGSEAASTQAVAAGEIPQDYVYHFTFDEADDSDAIQKVTCEAGSTMVPVDKEKNYIPGVKGEALYNDGIYGYDLTEVNGVGNSYTISYWTYCQRSALYMPNTIWGPDIKGNKDIGAEQWAAFDWLASDDDASLQVFPGVWSNEGAGVGRAEWKAAGSDPQTGHWMHLTLVVDENKVSADGNLYQATVYVDGQEYQKILNGEVAPVNIVKTAMVPADSFEFLLGINYWDAVFKGAFDELYIYDYALDASQVAALAADGDPTVALQEPERIIEPVVSEDFITALGNLSLVAEEGQFTTDAYPIKDGETFKFTLNNWSDGADTTDNYIMNFTTEAGDAVATIYADATGTLADGTDLTNDFTYTWGNWNTWLASVMKQAYPVITVSRDGETLNIKADNIDVYGTEGANVAQISVATGVAAEETINLTFTNKNSYVELVSVKDLTPKAGGIVVGSTDRTSGFWTEFSDIFAVPAGQSVTKVFTNYTSGAENWNNFCVILQSTPTGHSDATEGYSEYAVVRADNWGWGAGYDGIATAECDWNWDSFKEDMDGAKITLTITNNGDTADVSFIAETVSGTVYHQSYTGIALTGDLYSCLTVDNSYVNFDAVTVGNTDRTSAFWTAFSDIQAVPAGESKTIYFKNYTSGAENWNNFNVVLQNTPQGHSAETTEGYEEYAVVRSDNWGWGAGYDGIATAECDWNWDSFKEDMEGAYVALTVTNNGSTADVSAVVTTADGATQYHQNYTGIAVTGDLYFCLVMDGCYVTIEAERAGATDCSSAFWTQFSDIYPVAEGETVYKSFTNYTSGAENWNNCNVVLQSTPTGHADTTEGYSEYAVVRSDNWGWGAGYDGIATAECDWNWDSFKEDMNGAHVLLAVTNNGSTADVKAYVTTESGKVYTQTYTGIAVTGDLYFCFVMDGSYILIDGQ